MKLSDTSYSTFCGNVESLKLIFFSDQVLKLQKWNEGEKTIRMRVHYREGLRKGKEGRTELMTQTPQKKVILTWT